MTCANQKDEHQIQNKGPDKTALHHLFGDRLDRRIHKTGVSRCAR